MKVLRDIDKLTGDLTTLAEKFHKNTSIAILKGDSNEDIPIEWEHIHFKSYPRLEKVNLSRQKSQKNITLFKSIVNRRSERDLHLYKISKEEISKLLYFSSGLVKKSGEDWNLSKRAYPSAGARFPLEVYVAIFSSKDVKPGVYHYNVKAHHLELLLKGQFNKRIIQSTGQSWLKSASLVFIITSIIGRSKIKYGDRAYRYSLLEAGHAAQNMSLVADTLKLKCCCIGGFIDEKINSLLDLNQDQEFALYILAIGS